MRWTRVRLRKLRQLDPHAWDRSTLLELAWTLSPGNPRLKGVEGVKKTAKQIGKGEAVGFGKWRPSEEMKKLWPFRSPRHGNEKPAGLFKEIWGDVTDFRKRTYSDQWKEFRKSLVSRAHCRCQMLRLRARRNGGKTSLAGDFKVALESAIEVLEIVAPLVTAAEKWIKAKGAVGTDRNPKEEQQLKGELYLRALTCIDKLQKKA